MPVTTGSVTTKTADVKAPTGTGNGGYGMSPSNPNSSAAKSSTTQAAAASKTTATSASALQSLAEKSKSSTSVLSKTPTAADNTYSGPKGTNLGLNQAAKEASTRAAGYQPVTVNAGPKSLDTMARLMLAESKSLKNAAGKVSIKGLQAVGEVIKNRVLSEKFPNTVLGVIKQKSQFSPVKDGGLAKITSKDPNYKQALAVAKSVLDGTSPPITGNALNYGNIHTIMNKPGYSSTATKKAFGGMDPTLKIADAKNPISRSHTFGTIGTSDVNLPRFAGYERPSYPSATQVASVKPAPTIRNQYQPTTAAMNPKIMDRLAPERDVPAYTQYMPTKPAEQRNQYQPQMSSGEYLNQRVNQNAFARIASNDPGFVPTAPDFAVEKDPGVVGKRQDRIPATGPDTATQVEQMIPLKGDIQNELGKYGIKTPDYAPQSLLDSSIGDALEAIDQKAPWYAPQSMLDANLMKTLRDNSINIPPASMTQASYDPNGPVLLSTAPGGMTTNADANAVDPLAGLGYDIDNNSLQAPSQQGTMASPSQGPGKPVGAVGHAIATNPLVQAMNNWFGKNGTGANVPPYDSRGWSDGLGNGGPRRDDFLPMLSAMRPLYNSDEDFLNYLFGGGSYG